MAFNNYQHKSSSQRWAFKPINITDIHNNNKHSTGMYIFETILISSRFSINEVYNSSSSLQMLGFGSHWDPFRG